MRAAQYIRERAGDVHVGNDMAASSAAPPGTRVRGIVSGWSCVSARTKVHREVSRRASGGSSLGNEGAGGGRRVLAPC